MNNKKVVPEKKSVTQDLAEFDVGTSTSVLPESHLGAHAGDETSKERYSYPTQNWCKQKYHT